MGTDETKLAWLDKDKEISFSVKDCTISGSMLDSLKEGEICYEPSTGESYMGTATGYKPIRISYDEYPVSKIETTTITREQKQIETLIKAVTNLIKEVEELKKDNAFQYDKILVLEAENGTLKDAMEDMCAEMGVINDKIIILESRKADKEITLETSTLATCC